MMHRLSLIIAAVFVFAGCHALDEGTNDGLVKTGESANGPRTRILVPQFGLNGEQHIIPLAKRSDGLSHPRDLAFDPFSSGDLWVVDRDWDGNVVLFDAGTRGQRIDRMRDMAASHFMEEVSSVAFSNQGTFGTCQESRNNMDGFSYPNDFMGPVLWSTDLMIHCSVNQVENAQGLNGSHLDMLHQSPLCMGMAHQQGNAFFVADGFNGHIVRYDFQEPHVPGGHDHSDGIVSRYPELLFSRVPDVPSHMKLEGNILYYVDSGNGSLKIADVSSGRVGGYLTPRNEPLEVFNSIVDVAQRELISGLDTPSGLALTDAHIFLSFPKTGDIVAYDRNGVEVDRFVTGKPGVMGITIGPNGRLWYVNAYEGTVNVVDASGQAVAPAVDLIQPNYGDCVYPAWTEDVGVGEVMPPFAWSRAIEGRDQLNGFSALEIFCDPAWDGVDTVFFVVVPEWIPWLWEYVSYVDALNQQIENFGGRVVYVGAQTQNGGLIGLGETHRMLSQATPQGSGIRVAEADSVGSLRLIDTGAIHHLPAAFAVRRRDMRIIAAQSLRGTNHLPYVEIAIDSQRDWSEPEAPVVVATLPSNCDDGADEVYEPNDAPEEAAAIGFGQFQGGVCEQRGDFYYIDVDGPWRLSLEFSHAVGDLDVVLFRDGQPIVKACGELLGATSSNDNEQLDWADPITVLVYGYEGATAPYTLTVEAR